MARRTTTSGNRTSDTAVVAVSVERPAGIEPAERVAAEAARLATITTKADADAAGLFVQRARKTVKTIEAHYKRIAFGPMKRAYDAQRAEVTTDMDALLAPLQAADRLLSPVIEAWLKAERVRVQEAAAQQLNDATERAQSNKDATVRQLNAAAEEADTPAERRLLRQQARATAAAPLMPVVTSVARPVEAGVAGMTLRTSRHVEVHSLPLLVAAVAAGLVGIEALQPNVAWLDSLCNVQGPAFAVPGCVAVEDDSLAAKPSRG